MSKNITSIINHEDVESLTTLIQKLEESPFNFLKLENEDIKIVIGKNGVIETAEAGINNELYTDKQETAEEAENEAAATAIEQPIEKAATEVATPAAIEEEGTVTIKADTAGLFYAQSEPGAPPYVEVGDQVEKDTTVGLIEIMKVYSAITAGVKGQITAIHVENAQLVEYGQPLFTVKVN